MRKRKPTRSRAYPQTSPAHFRHVIVATLIVLILLLIAAVAARAEELPRHSSSPVALPVISIAAILKDFPPL